MFKNFIHLINKSKFLLLILSLIGFIGGYFITSFVVNNNFSYYTILVSGDSPKAYLEENSFNELLNNINSYNKKIANKEIEGTKIYLPSGTDMSKIPARVIIEENNNDTYTIKLPMGMFTTTLSSKTQKLNEGITKFKKTMIAIFDSTVSGIENENISVVSEPEHIGYQNPYLIGFYTALGLAFIYFILIIIASLKEHEINKEDISDNINIFKTPFHKEYWINATKVFKKIKNIAIISVLFALMMACKAIPLPSGFGALGISLTYLFFAIIAMLYGPIAGIVIGMMSDILGHFIFPPGMPFFPGYTLDSMLAGFTYGIFFYKSRISFSKCLFSRLIVNLFVNVFLGSIWWSILNSFTFDAYLTYMLLISLPKNLVYLLPQSLLLFILLKALMNPLKHFNLIDYRIADNVTIL